VCNFCDGSVQWLLAHDPNQHLHFAPLQGATAKALERELADFPTRIDSSAYVECAGDEIRVSCESEAIFRILEQLDPSARRWRFLRFLPSWLGNLAYRAFARNRYRLFGVRESCLVPSPEVRARFLP